MLVLQVTKCMNSKIMMFMMIFIISIAIAIHASSSFVSVSALTTNTNRSNKCVYKHHLHDDPELQLFNLQDFENTIHNNKKKKKSKENKNIRNSRRNFVQNSSSLMISSISAALLLVNNPEKTHAVPPAYVIAEELGYFPVTNRSGETTYISARVKRSSTDQAIALADFLSSKECNAVMYGAFWCPHCQRQKEMFGREAWGRIKYVECDGRGEGNKASVCIAKGVNEFPTWKVVGRGNGVKNGFEISGEMSLSELAKQVGYKGSFDPTLEPDFSVGSSASCG